MIILTGAAGFIGSCLLSRLNEEGRSDIIIVDDFSKEAKRRNYESKSFAKKIDREDFLSWFDSNHSSVDYVIHIGARTDTTEFDRAVFDKLNLNYSKRIWEICAEQSIPLIYASSAATYGMGEHGYYDDHGIVFDLKPLNPYGESKNEFDKWALQQDKQPPKWYGLKFFNVYGPNEYHKGRMASVILHAFGQIKNSGRVKLFRSHNPEFQDGKQLRDFIYVKDVTDVILFLMGSNAHPGLYNLGTGKARTFLDLANATFRALDLEPDIEFIDTPEDIRNKYQYFTEANMQKLRAAGYKKSFTSLEKGIHEYVQDYLEKNAIY